MSEWIAADIGGTKISAALYDGSTLSGIRTIRTYPEKGQNDVIRRFLELIEAVSENISEPIDGIGIACPGPLSAITGTVQLAPCLGWKDVPITRILYERFRCPVLLENDANAAALGEYTIGAGRGSRSMAYITVSTGVGCGIVLNGQILSGCHEGAGELGHVVIRKNGKKCPCGRRGCLERYASGTAIGEEARELLRRRGMPDESCTAQEAANLARAGDPEMRKIFTGAGDALGRGIAAMLQMLDPERIVLGGSVSKSLDLIKPSVVRAVRRESYWGLDSENWLVPSALGGDAGLWGAAILISRMTKRNVAVMIDRDGTMGYDPTGNHFYTPRDYQPFEDTADAFTSLRMNGIKALITTNQSCIARKLDEQYDFNEEFSEIGATDWFICPHDKDDRCSCRKPETGLLEQARDKYNLAMSQCYVIGDRWSDMAAGGKMGAQLIPVRTGFGKQTLGEDRERWQPFEAAYVADSLADAVRWIIARERQMI